MPNLIHIALPANFHSLAFHEFRWICNQNKSSQQFSAICTCTAQSLTANVIFVAVFLSRTFPGNTLLRFFSSLKQLLFEIISQVLCLHVEQVTQEAGILLMVGELLNQMRLFWRGTYWYKQCRCFKIFCCFSFPSLKFSTETKLEVRRVVIQG